MFSLLGDHKNTEKEYLIEGNSNNDQMSSKIFSEIRNGASPAVLFLQDLVKNNQLISENTSSLLIAISSIFLNKNEYNELLYSYISKALSPWDPLYTLLLISINKADRLESKYLLENWQNTFSIVVLNLLNRQQEASISQNQVWIYLDKLGAELFTKSKIASDQWVGLFFVFASRQQSIFKFLDIHAKNSWRIDINFNLLCSIDNILNEGDDDVYEVSKLRLSFYRGIIWFNCGVNYYTHGIKWLNNVIKRKEYLQNYRLKSTVDQAIDYRQRMTDIIDFQYKNKRSEENKQKGICLNFIFLEQPQVQSINSEEKSSGFFGYFSGFKSMFKYAQTFI